MQKLFYDFETFRQDCKDISKTIENQNFDTIIAIARGGVTFGHFLSSLLDIRKLYTISAISYDDTTKLDTLDISQIPDLSHSSKVLICDDIIDSGDTMAEIIKILKTKYPNIEFESVALFYKKDAIIAPTYPTKIADCWIEFFWEKI